MSTNRKNRRKCSMKAIAPLLPPTPEVVSAIWRWGNVLGSASAGSES